MTDPNTALHKCQEQLKEAQEKHNKDSELLAWDELGVLRCSMGQYSESIECFQNVANIAKESKQSDTEGRAYFKIAEAYNLLNTYAESIEYYNKCISTLKGKGEFKTERMAYYNIGIQYSMLGNDIKSIEYLETSLNMAVRAADRNVEKGCCFYLGNYNLSSVGPYEKAIFYFQRTLLLCQETGDFCKPIEVITCSLGDAYAACEKYGEAIKHHKQSLEYAIQNDNKVIEKELYKRLVLDSNRVHDYPKAVEYSKKYQNLAKLTGDKIGEVDGYREAGIAYYEINDNESALNCFQNSLRIAIEVEDKELVEYGYANVATVYYKLRKFKQAIEHFEKSVAYSIERGNHTKECETYANIATTYFDLGSHKQAIECLNKCLVISRGISDKDREQMDLFSIGEVHNNLGNYKDAMESYERCLSLAIKTGNKNNEERIIYRLGILYSRLRYHKKAIEFLEKHLRTAVQKGDRLDEAETSVELANVYGYVAIARYDEAFEILDKTLRIAVELGDIGLQSGAHLKLSHVHFVLGNKKEQYTHVLESVRLAEKCGDETLQIVAYRNLAALAIDSNDGKNALEFAKKELQLAKGSIHKIDHEFANYDIGYAYYLTGNIQDARTHIEKCLDLAKETGDKSMEAKTYEYLGDIYRRENAPNATEKAFQCYENQLHLALEIEDKTRVGKAYCNLGTLFLHLYLKEKSTKQKERAESYFMDSLRSYDLFFRDLKENDERKINVIETFLFVHEELALLYIEDGELEKALFVSEQEKGRALEDILKRKYMLDDTHKPSYDFLGNYKDIKSKILSSDRCILFFSGMVNSTLEFQVGTWVLTVAEQVTFYRNELQQIKFLLQKNDLDEYVEKRSWDILNAIVDTAISLQRSTDSEDRSFSIHRYTGAGSATLDSYDSHKRCVYDEELNENYLEVLYDTLIAPVQDTLIHQEIVIVPDGPLFKVPFAALRNPQTGSFLSETKRLRIAPSLTTLKIMKESSAESHSLTGALIVGDPDVDGKRILRGEERSFHSLPNARLEAEKIGKVLGVEALTGKQASKQVFIERLRQGVAVIHLAAHGCAETGEIILSPSADHPTDKIPKEEDYLLTINEVQQIGLRARLVVLSCCHSGRGEIMSEGVIGMSRAFLAAGALAVVASLWAVDDEGTRVFMEQFYTHLKQGKTASTSLQQAMKDMRNMPRFNKPMYWAPFVLIGDDVTINID